MIDLSIIIVNYNTKTLILNCLEAIKKSKLAKYTLQLILVDNGSVDGSFQALKNYKAKLKDNQAIVDVKLVDNGVNVGFAAGNNQGLRQAKGRYLLLLNSDTQVYKNNLRDMITFMDSNKQFSAATCRLEFANGQMDPACHRGFPTPWAALIYFTKLEKFFPKVKLFSGYHQGWKDLSKVHEVEVISGAFFMIRKEVIKKVGLLDEGFFMYGEDIDWCKRINEAGLKIAFNPNAKVLHLKGRSGIKSRSKIASQKTRAYFWETMKLFYQKHYKDKYPKLLMWFIFKIINLQKKRIKKTN